MKLIYDKEYKVVLNLDLMCAVYIDKVYADNGAEYTYYKVDFSNGETYVITKEMYDKIVEMAK